MQARADFTQSLAVVIGIDAYTHGIPPLRTAANDARKLAQLLQDHHGYTTHCLLDDQATAERITHLLKTELPQHLTPDDRLLFYFAGHGVALDSDEGPRGYLLPHDARREDPDSFLRMHAVHQALNALDCRHLLVILDSCFSGAFRWSATRSSFAASSQVLYRERYDRFIQDPAWQVLTSASYDQKASDQSFEDRRGQVGEHSPFAHALFAALETDAADRFGGEEGGDGVVTAEELFLFLEQAVQPSSEAVGRRQTPELWTLERHDKGQFIFHVPGHEVALEPAPTLDEASNPYRGLKSYEKEQAKAFFGREAVIEALYGYVAEHPLTVVLGASGTGKSSVVKAGLVPKLEGDVEQQWHVLPVVRPGASPLRSLVRALAGLEEEAPGTPGIAARLEARVKAWCAAHPDEKLVLVIDQFEELVTMTRQAEEREAVLALLARLVKAHPERLRVIVTLRTDFEPQFTETVLKDHWQEARYVVPPMTREDLRQVIEGPAAQMVVYFDPSELVETLVDEVAATPGGLPLLSFTLSEMYVRLHTRFLTDTGVDRSLTEEDYAALGGVVGALRKRADEEYQALNEAHRKTMRRVMLRMVSFEGSNVARQRVRKSDLTYPDEAETKRVEAVVEKLRVARLLVTGQEDDGESYVEPAHDALVRAWDRLLGWIHAEEEKQASLRFQQRLAGAAWEWDQTRVEKAKTGLLWRDPARSALLSQLLKERAGWMNQREVAFAKRSVRSRRRIRMGLVATGIVIVLLALGATVAFFIARSNARQASDEAARSRGALLGRQAQTLEETWASSSLNVLVAIEAMRLAHSTRRHDRIPAAESVIRHSLFQATGLGLTGYQGAIPRQTNTSMEVRFSPDSRWLFTGHAFKGLLMFWDLNAPLPGTAYHILRNVGNYNYFAHMASSVDWLATVEAKPSANTSESTSTIHLWDLTSKNPTEHSQVLHHHEGAIHNLAISPDGQWLVVATDRGTLIRWNLTRQPFQADTLKKTLSRSLYSLLFTPDSRWLAAGGEGNLRLWAMHESPDAARTLAPARPIMVSSDNQWLIAAPVREEEAFLWNLRTGTQAATIGVLDFSYGESKTQFSPDGRWLLVNDTDYTLFALTPDIAVARTIPSLYQATFTPDSRWLIEVTTDSLIRLEDIHTGQPIPLPEATLPFALSRDHLATGSSSGTVLLWDMQGTHPVLRARVGPGEPLAFNPDGRWLFINDEYGRWESSGGPKSRIQAWHLDPARRQPTLEKVRDMAQLGIGYMAEPSPTHASNGWVYAREGAAFSRDGRWMFIGGSQHHLLWDLSQRGDSLVHTGLPLITTEARSADQRTLYTGHLDGTVRTWDLTRPLSAPSLLSFSPAPASSGPILWIVGSPDNRHLITVDPTMARLWRREETRYIHVSDFQADELGFPLPYHNPTKEFFDLGTMLSTHRDVNPFLLQPIRRFSREGRWLLTQPPDGPARLWDVSSDTLQAPRQMAAQAQISPDGRWLAVSTENDSIQVYDFAHFDAPPRTLAGGTFVLGEDLLVTKCGGNRLSPDGRWFISVLGFLDMKDMPPRTDHPDDEACTLWDLANPDRAPVLVNHDAEIAMPNPGGGVSINFETLTFSPDSRWMVPRFTYAGYTGAGYGSDIRLMDTHAEDPLATLTPLMEEGYRSLVFSPDGRWLAIDSLLWDLQAPSPGIEPFALSSIVLAFDMSGRYVLTQEQDLEAGTSRVRYWPLQVETMMEQGCGVTGRNLSRDEWRQYFPGEPYRKVCPELPGPIE